MVTMYATHMHSYSLQSEDGPIDAPKTVQDVRQEPYPLPERWVGMMQQPHTQPIMA